MQRLCSEHGVAFNQLVPLDGKEDSFRQPGTGDDMDGSMDEIRLNLSVFHLLGKYSRTFPLRILHKQTIFFEEIVHRIPGLLTNVGPFLLKRGAAHTSGRGSTCVHVGWDRRPGGLLYYNMTYCYLFIGCNLKL